MTDEQLVRKILSGDDAALQELHERYVDRVFQYLYIQINDFHDAQDLLQDVLFKAAKNMAGFQGKSTFKTWLFAITKHAVIDYYRTQNKQKRSTTVENDTLESFTEPQESAEQTVMRQTDTDEVLQRLNSLPESYRNVLHLRFVEGFSVKETAQVLGKTSMSVKAIQRRARRELANRIDWEVNVNE